MSRSMTWSATARNRLKRELSNGARHMTVHMPIPMPIHSGPKVVRGIWPIEHEESVMVAAHMQQQRHLLQPVLTLPCCIHAASTLHLLCPCCIFASMLHTGRVYVGSPASMLHLLHRCCICCNPACSPCCTLHPCCVTGFRIHDVSTSDISTW